MLFDHRSVVVGMCLGSFLSGLFWLMLRDTIHRRFDFLTETIMAYINNNRPRKDSGKLVIDPSYVRRIVNEIALINGTPIEEIVITEDGEMVKIPTAEIERFKRSGETIVQYIKDEGWKA